MRRSTSSVRPSRRAVSSAVTLAPLAAREVGALDAHQAGGGVDHLLEGGPLVAQTRDIRGQATQAIELFVLAAQFFKTSLVSETLHSGMAPLRSPRALYLRW